MAITKTQRKARKAAYNVRAWENRKSQPKLLNHLVATRVSGKLDRDFRVMCKAKRVRYSTQIRRLIERFTWGTES